MNKIITVFVQPDETKNIAILNKNCYETINNWKLSISRTDERFSENRWRDEGERERGWRWKRIEKNNYAKCKRFHAKVGKCQWMVNVSIWKYRNMPINANCTKWSFTSNQDSPTTIALYQSSVLLPESKWTQHSSRRLFSSHA